MELESQICAEGMDNQVDEHGNMTSPVSYQNGQDNGESNHSNMTNPVSYQNGQGNGESDQTISENNITTQPTDSVQGKDKNGSLFKTIRTTIIVEPVVLLYALAKVPLGPLLQQYVYSEVAKLHGISQKEVEANCSTNRTDPHFILQQSIQSDAARWSILFGTCSLLPSIFATIILSSYSEVFGRKAALIVSILGAVFMAFLNLIVVGLQLDFRLIMIGGFIEGLTGGSSTFFMACYAFIADSTDHKMRTRRLFFMELALGIGAGISSITVGYMIKDLGYTWPLFVCELIFVLCFLLTIVHVPDKRPDQSNENAKKLSFREFTNIFHLYTKDNGSNRLWKLQLCLVVLFFTQLVYKGLGDVTTYFLLNSPLCFSSVLIGYQMAIDISFKFTGATIFLSHLYRKFLDLKSILISCVSGMVSQIIMAVAFTKFMPFVSSLFGCLSPILVAIMRSYLSKQVGSHEQGTLFASVALTEQTTALLGNWWFNEIYANTVTLYSGTVFVVTAFCIGISLIVTCIMLCKSKNIKPPEPITTVPTPDDTTDIVEENAANVNNVDHSDKTILV